MTEHFVLESATAILVVVIPSVLGAVITKLTVNTWQEKKEKFKLKKDHLKFKHEIQKDCDMTIAAVLSNVMFFRNAIRDNYYTKWELGKDDKIHFHILIPDGKENLPEKLLSEALKKFRTKRLELNREAWRFFSIINVYFESKKIGKDYNIFFDLEDDIQGLISLIASTTKTEDLGKYNSLLNKKSEKLLNIGSDVSLLIAKTPLKKLQE